MNFYDYFKLYGPIVITLVCAVVVTVVLVWWYRRRQERARSVNPAEKRTARTSSRKHKSSAPSAGPRPQKKGTAPRTLPVQNPLGMTICPKCKMQVFPKADGTCPSCQAKIWK